MSTTPGVRPCMTVVCLLSYREGCPDTCLDYSEPETLTKGKTRRKTTLSPQWRVHRDPVLVVVRPEWERRVIAAGEGFPRGCDSALV